MRSGHADRCGDHPAPGLALWPSRLLLIHSPTLTLLPAACLLRRTEFRSALAGASPDRRRAQATKPGKFAVSQRVRHATFGLGEVRAVSGSGPQQKVSVYFDEAGPKTLLPRFLTKELCESIASTID